MQSFVEGLRHSGVRLGAWTCVVAGLMCVTARAQSTGSPAPSVTTPDACMDLLNPSAACIQARGSAVDSSSTAQQMTGASATSMNTVQQESDGSSPPVSTVPQQEYGVPAGSTSTVPQRRSDGSQADPAATPNTTQQAIRPVRGPAPVAPKPPEPPREEPTEIRVQDPYGNLVSLRDLYTQVPSSGTPPRRFGSEAFLLGTGNANELPSDLPVGPDYVLGPGDQIVVNMWGGHAERLNVTVDRQGQIALPEAGTVVINGMTLGQAQAAIQRSLSSQFQGEHVEISLGRLRTVRVYVVGDVQRPGAYDVSSLSTPLSVLYAAGGPTARGSLRILKQYRGSQLIAQVDLYDFLLKGVRSNVERLQPGDTLLVPPVGPQVTVEGMVHHPAIYELNGETTLNQVLELAGGVLPTASLKQINVGRVEANTRRTMLELDLPAAEDGIKQAIAGFKVQGGDDIVISQILPYNQQMVYLDGHVYRPGRYPYREGMTLVDLLHSYQDVLPEPADRGEIVRLVAPDFHPETISFNLADVLVGGVSVPLKPFDLVRISGRYVADAPRVTIDGQVLRPGNYPLAQGMTVSALIRMAGGFNRSAFRDSAGLSSYVVENGQRVMIRQSLVDLPRAMSGDKQADSPLQPGDLVSVRQIAGWTDIGSSVSVVGEVQHPGGYGIVEGERLSSVLKRAGGYRSEAYPSAAILNRLQVLQLNRQARDLLIQRLVDTPINYQPSVVSAQNDQVTQQSLEMQRNRAITDLRDRPVTGRLVVDISGEIGRWEGSASDIPLRSGDVVTIPKLPNFVLISGEVYNPVAISYIPGKRVKDYLLKAGGLTNTGDKKRIYILRADGSVVAHGSGWGSISLLNVQIHPGDTIFAPEKIIGGSQVFRDVLATAQVLLQSSLLALVAGGV